MTISTDPKRIEELLTRSIAEIYPNRAELKTALLSGKRLTFYVGIDPTAGYVHLGHATNYLLLERLHALGHKVIVLVGDFTAMIGDPSDKTAARVQLTFEQVKTYLATFKEQIGKILDFTDTENPIEFKFNNEWLSSLTFRDAVELASNFTVQQMIERDAFKKRLTEQKPLYVHEFFYPLMQGYDSVAMDVDAEVGGTDQTFNMLAGRVLLKRYKNKEKFVIATTLLENPETGEKLMSKSLGTGVGLNEPPKEMFSKVMKLPDAGVIQTFIDCTRLTMEAIEEIKKSLASGTNPRDIKLRLAYEVVTMYDGKAAADAMQEQWIAEVSNRQLPTDIAEHALQQSEQDIHDLLVDLKIVTSKGEARRLVQQGAIRLNEEKVTDAHITVHDGDILQVGKKHTIRLKLNA